MQPIRTFQTRTRSTVTWSIRHHLGLRIAVGDGGGNWSRKVSLIDDDPDALHGGRTGRYLRPVGARPRVPRSVMGAAAHCGTAGLPYAAAHRYTEPRRCLPLALSSSRGFGSHQFEVLSPLWSLDMESWLLLWWCT
ncbi:hypothetical protein B296_00021029 [Ensete ventricosum]|uniref:Uncharacterized protein n=1 Tax=Ensete ventricosum TaxID=4639 RepID=A0A426YWS0_ENSVE|nr:hypothetical protein B296_00021029 [Ensete ventricosum]